MRAAAAVALLALGCASAPVTVRYEPGEPGPLGGAHPSLVEVTVEPEGYGRQCFDLTIEPDGTVGITYAVDASSDYAGIRVLPSIVPEIVSAIMAVVGAPIDLIGQLLGVERELMPEPSAISACAAIFEQ